MRYFIAHALPHNMCVKYNTSVACANFTWPLIDSNVFDKCFSILPINVWGNIEDIHMKDLAYNKCLRSSKYFHLFAPIWENIMLFPKIKKGSSVWLYNISVLNIVLYFLIKWFKPTVKLYVMILDFMNPEKKSKLDYLILWALNHANGTIRVSNWEHFTCKNSMCLPGVVPTDNPEFPRQDTISKTFLLSGLLRKDISQIDLVIDAFSKLPDVELYISGFAADEDNIREKCKSHRNIHFLGCIEYNRYMELLNNVSFVMSMRNPKLIENKCNFPSKIIEAILHNKIIVSTIHYEQLNGLKYFEVSSDCNSLIADIQRIISIEKEELMLFANQAEYAKKHFSPAAWNMAMKTIESRDSTL